VIIDSFLLHFKEVTHLVRLQWHVLNNWCGSPCGDRVVILHCSLWKALHEILMLLDSWHLMRGLHSHFHQFVLGQHLVCILVNVLVRWPMGVDWVVRYYVDATLRPQFLLRGILDVVVLCNSTTIVR
jgi:hypothetical protein